MEKHLLLYEESNVFNDEQATEGEKTRPLICSGVSSSFKDGDSVETSKFVLKLGPATKLPLSGQPITITRSSTNWDHDRVNIYPGDPISAFTGESAVGGKWYFIPAPREITHSLCGSCFNAELVSSGTTATTEEGVTYQMTYGEFRGTLPGQSSPTNFFCSLDEKWPDGYFSLNDGTGEVTAFFASLSDLIDMSNPMFFSLAFRLPAKLGGAKHVTSVIPGVAYVIETNETFYNMCPFSITVKYFEERNDSPGVAHYISATTFNDVEASLSEILGDWASGSGYRKSIQFIDNDPLVDGERIPEPDAVQLGIVSVDSTGNIGVNQNTLTFYDLECEYFNERANGKVLTLISRLVIG